MPRLTLVQKRIAVVIVSACSLYYCCQVAGQEKLEPTILFRIQPETSSKAILLVAHSPDKSVELRRAHGSKPNNRVQLFADARDMPLGPEIELKGSITAWAVSPDNTTVATAIGNQDRGEIHFWNGTTGNEVKYFATEDDLPSNLGVVTKLSFSDDGETVTGSAAPFFFRVRLETNAKPKPEAIYSPDKSVVLRRFINSVRIQLFNAARDLPLGPEINPRGRVTALAVSPDNRTIATAIGRRSGYWGEVRVWDGTSGTVIAKYTRPGIDGSFELGEVTKLSFSDDGKTLTVVSGPCSSQ